MKTPAKLGLGLLAVVVAGLIFASVFLMQNLDGIVKRLIEDTGSNVIGTKIMSSLHITHTRNNIDIVFPFWSHHFSNRIQCFTTPDTNCITIS